MISLNVTLVDKLFSPEFGYMQTSLMLLWGCMDENTLPCGEQTENVKDVDRPVSKLIFEISSY